jgi:hypothetical protein
LTQELFKENSDIKFVIPKKMNQDSLENFFSWLRSNLGPNCHPNLYQIGFLFGKRLSLNQIHNQPNSNCLEDENNILQIEKGKLLENSDEEVVWDDLTIEINNKNHDYDYTTIRYETYFSFFYFI